MRFNTQMGQFHLFMKYLYYIPFRKPGSNLLWELGQNLLHIKKGHKMFYWHLKYPICLYI